MQQKKKINSTRFLSSDFMRGEPQIESQKNIYIHVLQGSSISGNPNGSGPSIPLD